MEIEVEIGGIEGDIEREREREGERISTHLIHLLVGSQQDCSARKTGSAFINSLGPLTRRLRKYSPCS